MIKNNRRQFIKKTCLAAGIAISPFENIYPITNKAIEENSIIKIPEIQKNASKNTKFVIFTFPLKPILRILGA